MTEPSARDTLFSNEQPQLVDFAFDEQVARVFPDMIRRSVPGYDTVIAMTGVFARHYATPDSRIYDLGCSLGASTLSMMKFVQAEGVEFIAIDNAPAMLEQCRTLLSAQGLPRLPSLVCSDVREVDIRQASLAVLNFTLMFVPLDERPVLLRRIYDGLLPGGALVLSEKILVDEHDQWLLTDLHHDFKRSNGYSDTEIDRKRQSIENVLVPEHVAVHEQRLREAGFSHVSRWFQCFTFCSWVAVK